MLDVQEESKHQVLQDAQDNIDQMLTLKDF